MTKLILMLLMVVAVGLFAAQNTDPVAIKFLCWHARTVPSSLLVILGVAAGAVIGLLAMAPIHFRNRRELARHRRELESLRDGPPA